MSKKYTYSRSINFGEVIDTFTAVEFDSFEEAKMVVEKGIRDHMSDIEKSIKNSLPDDSLTPNPNPSKQPTTPPKENSEKLPGLSNDKLNPQP